MSISPTPSARQLRKAAVQSAKVTVALAQRLQQTDENVELVAEVLFSRGFLGRLKWLVTGR